ncbi:hypothetical protein P691DRAFT_810456 [Macrolepiota fuliginosa MF-IS2]|uniref:Uncharacterized protein n=1 Tax=Macrolepiota fuliginosa MF-IS2 TaxID=1400762 RepID=A0A9P5XHD3_9AGAR|nr:hypothetical protein P691DRAFT_810456 [Macrolepiota fuliginosa MF-IS2]
MAPGGETPSLLLMPCALKCFLGYPFLHSTLRSASSIPRYSLTVRRSTLTCTQYAREPRALLFQVLMERLRTTDFYGQVF